MANTELDEEIIRLVKRADAVTVEAALATMEAMIAGKTPLEALKAGNAVFIAAGRDPLPEDVFLARMAEVRRDP